ncbi:MAG: sensor histidine kinase [Sphingobacteriales bacterium]|nr:MAG: sensor histidine kinase [Sphingobacteriales bacterium]
MRDNSSFKIALYVSLGVAVCCGGLSIFLPLLIWQMVVITFLPALLAFFIGRFLIQKYIISRVIITSEHIIESLKDSRFKSSVENSNLGEMEVLENAVKRLMTEQTTEIGHLKELERMRKEFLGDVAHELRSPIFNIQGYIHTLIEGALEDAEVSHKFLGKAAKHVDHLSSLVEDLVTISRIEAGELKLEVTEFDIKELIKEVIDLQDLAAKQKNINLKCRFDEQVLLVRADRPKIKQVLNNLVGNSIKYGHEEGHTVINIEEAPGTVTIKITDNGEGIAEEHLPRIFERFYRVDKSRARTVPSTGLGLAIVKHFIEAHNQKILVTSREGVGSIFSFSLQRGA